MVGILPEKGSYPQAWFALIWPKTLEKPYTAGFTLISLPVLGHSS
jgi:hypothetical protein